jgi:dual specificity phosphatase 3
LTHIIDVRIEANDEDFVGQFAEARGVEVGYLHHGIDDAGQRVPAEWFETGVGYALEAIESGGIVLTHCHMGINRGPSLGFAVLLAQGWDPVVALTAIRAARRIAYVDYAQDALFWHHQRSGSSSADRHASLQSVAQWRRDNHLDPETVIRGIRAETER